MILPLFFPLSVSPPTSFAKIKGAPQLLQYLLPSSFSNLQLGHFIQSRYHFYDKEYKDFPDFPSLQISKNVTGRQISFTFTCITYGWIQLKMNAKIYKIMKAYMLTKKANDSCHIGEDQVYE